ncbi:MAG TPA: VanZ family protein [Thermoanaerobaculia bacterium]
MREPASVPVPAKRLRRVRIAALVWGVFLLSLTSYPSPPAIPVIGWIPSIDKFIHFMLYGIEAFLLYLSLRWPGRDRFSLARVLALTGLMAVWAVADETHQYWIPGRSMEGGDVIGDVSGSIAGGLVASAVSGRREKKGLSPPLSS